MALVVAFEGLPGCGKTTVARLVASELKQCGLRVRVVGNKTAKNASVIHAIKESCPTGHPVKILLCWVLRLMQYDFMEKISSKVDVVLMDRSWSSVLAFDVYGNGLPEKLLAWVGRYVKRQPDLTFLFEAPMEIIRDRKQSETTADLKFALRVKRGYRELARKFSWVHIDATRGAAQVRDCCLRAILSKL